MYSPNRLQRRARRGAALVEFAVVAPILMLILLGTIEFGRVMLLKNSVTAAAREAAREATLPSSTEQTVTDAATNYTDQVSPETATVSISPLLISVEAGDMITVTVTIPASAISPLGSTWMGENFQVGSSASMRRECYQ